MTDDLAHLEALALAAMPGFWRTGETCAWGGLTSDDEGDDAIPIHAPTHGCFAKVVLLMDDGSEIGGAVETAEFIAAFCPARTLPLIAELRTARARIAELEEANARLYSMINKDGD